MPSSFHPLYISAVTLGGVVLALLGAYLFGRASAVAEAYGKKVTEGGGPSPVLRFIAPSLYRDPVGQLRWRHRLIGVVTVLMGLALIVLAITSIWDPQCGTVLDLPPCH